MTKSGNFLWYILFPLSVVCFNISCSDDLNIEDHPVMTRTTTAKRISVQQTYPSVAEIIANPTVKTAMNTAWSNMKSAASYTGRSEYGFYIYYDSNSKQYTCGNMVKGPNISGCEGTNANVSLGKVTNNLTVCAFFHCHTTLEYCPSTVSRTTGPSSSDKSFANSNKLPGILYDYSTRTLVGGTSKNASYKIYTFGPTRRTLY